MKHHSHSDKPVFTITLKSRVEYETVATLIDSFILDSIKPFSLFAFTKIRNDKVIDIQLHKF